MPEVDPDGLASQRAASGGSSRSYVAFDPTQITSPDNRSNPQPGDPCHPLAAEANAPAIAFSCKDHGADVGETSPTLRSMGHDGSHANAGGQVAIATAAYVRRLTPRECERLQGFPDDYTLIPGDHRPRKPEDRAETVAYLIEAGFPPDEASSLADHPDGPRYKALGNSKAVPVVRWSGERIELVESLTMAMPAAV